MSYQRSALDLIADGRVLSALKYGATVYCASYRGTSCRRRAQGSELCGRRSSRSAGGPGRAAHQQRPAGAPDVSRGGGDVFCRVDRRLSGFPSWQRRVAAAVSAAVARGSDRHQLPGAARERLVHALRLTQWLVATALLGVVFLCIQGYEWIRLVQFGLKVSSSVYGATFYTLIGCHGLHVLGAGMWLMGVSMRAHGGRYTAQRHTGVELWAMYWTFVVSFWPGPLGLLEL